MLTYYIMFFVPAIAAMANVSERRQSNIGAWSFIGFLLIVIIGLRMSGGDWLNYYDRFNEMAYLTLEEAVSIKEPSYQLISYYMYEWGWGFSSVTLICALISVTGLIIFLRNQVNPWLGLAVAVPYLIIVVYMGYMRQGVALGLVMWGIAALEQGKFLRFVVLVVVAATFHKSAILMIAFGIFQHGGGRYFKFLALIFVAIGVWSSFVGDAEVLWQHYVEEQMQSQGAIIRVLLNLVPAVLLIVFRKRWKEEYKDYVFWVSIALASFASVGLVGFASTAVDRMALYFLPLQIAVFSRLPFLARNWLAPQVTAMLVLLLYFAILFVWLNFANNKWAWNPYTNVIFVELFS